MTDQRTFDGKVVLVTGVARVGQIGHAVALAFGRAGAKLVLCDRNAVEAAARAREFAAEGIDARPTAGDLTEPDIARLAVETAIRHFGRLDVVVNVAGGLTTFGPIAGTGVADFDREIAINLKTVLVSQAAVPALAETRGVIVNFASVAFFRPRTRWRSTRRPRRVSPPSRRAWRSSSGTAACASTRWHRGWSAPATMCPPLPAARCAGWK
jgi:NAD(P)-dependent dehydrogenase (short-subunit alcohol dehydrogenase family)